MLPEICTSLASLDTLVNGSKIFVNCNVFKIPNGDNSSIEAPIESNDLPKDWSAYNPFKFVGLPPNAILLAVAISCFIEYLLAPGSFAINSASSGFLLTRIAVP